MSTITKSNYALSEKAKKKHDSYRFHSNKETTLSTRTLVNRICSQSLVATVKDIVFQLYAPSHLAT